MSSPLLGSIIMFAGNFAPRGWAMCEGQLLSISQNTALFSILGTTYGGNGVSTFALPDLRGRAPIQQGQGPGLSPFALGQSGGAESTTLSPSNMPIHNHLLNCNTGGGNQASPSGGFPAVESTGTSMDYNSVNDGHTMSPAMVGNAGGNQPFSIRQPYLAVNFIIALQGIFPSRS